MHLNPSASQSQTKHAHWEASRRLRTVGYMLHLGGKGEEGWGWDVGGGGRAVFLCGVGLHKCTYNSFIFVIYGTHIPVYDMNTDQSINCTTSFPCNWGVVV